MSSSPVISSSSVATAYWCYRCVRFVTLPSPDALVACPHCASGFIEEINAMPSSHSEDSNRRFSPQISGAGPPVSPPAATRHALRFRRRRGGINERTLTAPFNPVVVLRGPTVPADGEDEQDQSNRYEFYYDDGSGSGLRPVPPGVSDFLMGWGFDRLLEQLSNVEGLTTGRRGRVPVPASKAAIEAMPTVAITEHHVSKEEHCAVCTEPLEAGVEAREMPCRHLYHPDCILPWLAVKNSCPVCRSEVEAEASAEEDEGEAIGLTIWRLPGGGFAVGRFNGGRGGSSLVLPEIVGQRGVSAGSTPRRVLWRRRSNRDEQPMEVNSSGVASRFRGVLRGLASLLRGRSTVAAPSPPGTQRRRRHLGVLVQ